MKQYTEDMDQKSPGNKGSLVYAGIKSIVKSSLGKKILFFIFCNMFLIFVLFIFSPYLAQDTVISGHIFFIALFLTGYFRELS